MIGRKDPVSAGRTYEFRCQAVGARPPPQITWWRGSAQLRDNVTNRVRFSLLSRTQAGPGREGRQEQKQISPNHVQKFERNLFHDRLRV